MSTSLGAFTNSKSVLRGHILQVSSPLLRRLRYSLLRYLLDLRRQRLQHHIQDPVPRLFRVHNLPYDHRLQANPRSKPRYLQSTILTWWLLGSRSHMAILLHTLRNHLGLQYLARKCGNHATIIDAAKNWRSRDHYGELSVCVGHLQGAVYPELDLEILG